MSIFKHSQRRLFPLLLLALAGVSAGFFLFLLSGSRHTAWDEHTCGCATEASHHVYLLLTEVPSHSILVCYFTRGAVQSSSVEYDTSSRNGLSGKYTYSATGTSKKMPGSDTDWVHQVLLTGLQPGTTYYFVAGEDSKYAPCEMHFRTCCDDRQRIRVVVGGDMDTSTEGMKLLARAAACAPEAVLLGGDIAQCKGRLDNGGRWRDWMHRWSSEMKTPDGRLIPFAAAIGDNEVESREGAPLPKGSSPFFPVLCRQFEATSYMATSIGKSFEVFLLDSGHQGAFDGEQLRWLETALVKAPGPGMLRFAVYHMPAWPAAEIEPEESAAAIRSFWAPRFEQYGVQLAFEHHEHLLKRTVPIKACIPARTGVVYLGGGAYGSKTRTPRNTSTETFNKTAAASHFWLIEDDTHGFSVRAVGCDGEILDQTTISIGDGEFGPGHTGVVPAPFQNGVAQDEGSPEGKKGYCHVAG